MFRFQIALAIILVGCITFLSCGREPGMLEDVMTEEMTEEMMPEMMETIDTILAADAYKAWVSVTLPEAVDTGVAHQGGSRTIYFNEAAAMANMAGGGYPAGSIIVKETMAGTFTMMKTDDAMYAEHNNWIYGKPSPLAVADSMGCHGCHAKAANDSVFILLEKPPMTDDDMAGDDMTGDDMAGDDMAGDDMAGDDMAGDDMTGDDMAGDDMAGDDMAGDDMAGDDMAGDDTDDAGGDTTDDGTGGNGDTQ